MSVPRGSRTRSLWWGLWGLWAIFVLQQALSDARFGAPLQLMVLQVLPLLVFMPGVARDNLRSVIWLCFVLLGYFVLAVLAVFAQPEDGYAIVGIVVVVLLFMVATFYIRFRGRELRAQTAVTDAAPEES